MSSIGNNNNNNPNNAPSLTPEDAVRRNLEEVARKRSAKALLAAGKHKSSDIIDLLGLNAIKSTEPATGAPAANKFSAAGAAHSLGPPRAPQTKKITHKTLQEFESMARSVNAAIGSVAAGAQPVNWHALTPVVKATQNPAEAKAQAIAATAAAKKAVAALGSQYSHLSSIQMIMAFGMLRDAGGSESLNIYSQLGDMQTAVRKSSLDQQIAEDKKAQQALNKSMKKQKQMGVLEPLIAAIFAVLAVAVTVLSAGTLTGLALTAAAMVIGFCADGAATGAKKGNGFDITGALEGLSMGAMAMPVGMVVMTMFKSMEMTLEKVAGSAVTTAIKGAEKQATQKAAEAALTATKETLTTAGRDAGQSAAKKTEADVQKAATEAAEKKSNQAALAEGEAAAPTDESGMQATSSALARGVHKSFGEQFMARYTALQGKLAALQKSGEAGLVNTKTERSLILGTAVLQAGTDTLKNVETYRISQLSLDSQEDINLGKMCGEAAKVAQDEWKGSQDILSALQEHHNNGITQTLSMFNAHAEANTKVAQYISS